MKHYRMILATLFVALISFTGLTAQQDKIQSQPKTTEHLKFMGIPIDGSPTAFANKLKSKGFTLKDSPSPNVIWMTGTFAGVSNSDIFIYKYLYMNISELDTPANVPVIHITLGEGESLSVNPLLFSLFAKAVGDPSMGIPINFKCSVVFG